MNNPSTVEQLREMRFSAMANEFEAQLHDPATYAQVPFEDRFGLLVNAEWNRRQANKLARRVRDAHLDPPPQWKGLSTTRTGSWTRLR